jgi:hypothetical protein
MTMALEGPDEAAQERYREFQAGMVVVEMPPARVAQNQIEDMVNQSFAAQFFQRLADKPECCLESVAAATESLALLERDLFRKAVETLDEARDVASKRSDAGLLLQVANSYRDLAQAAS